MMQAGGGGVILNNASDLRRLIPHNVRGNALNLGLVLTPNSVGSTCYVDGGMLKVANRSGRKVRNAAASPRSTSAGKP